MKNKKIYIFLVVFIVFLQFFCVNLILNNKYDIAFCIEKSNNNTTINNVLKSVSSMLTIEAYSGRILYKKDEKNSNLLKPWKMFKGGNL